MLIVSIATVKYKYCNQDNAQRLMIDILLLLPILTILFKTPVDLINMLLQQEFLTGM